MRSSTPEWCKKVAGATPINQAEPRQVATIAGEVERLRIRPEHGVRAIEATLADGSGSITAVWLGRRSIKGLALGRRMVIGGRLAEKDGQRAIMNPTYEFADS